MNEELEHLCQNFNFKMEEFFGNTKIISNNGRDCWYVAISPQIIKLYHMNKRNSGGYHHQKDFKDKSMYEVFKYIKDHDSKFKNPKKYGKLFKILGIINQLSVNNVDRKQNIEV